MMTIFVRLLDEGTNVWRPVEARQLNTETFVIVSENESPEDEIWEFDTAPTALGMGSPGDLVRI